MFKRILLNEKRKISDEQLEEAIENGSVGNGTPNDDGSEAVELSDRQKEMLRKAFEKQEKFIGGDVQKTKLSKKDITDHERYILSHKLDIIKEMNQMMVVLINIRYFDNKATRNSRKTSFYPTVSSRKFFLNF